MEEKIDILEQLSQKFGSDILGPQAAADGVPTLWVSASRAWEVLRFLKQEISRPYSLLYDIAGIDERNRAHKPNHSRDYTVVYHLMSFDRNSDIRIKVPLVGDSAAVRTISDIWPCANWYERELWDMFGVEVHGHPDMRRIFSPPWWQGHPLRKDHPARATEMEPFTMPDDKWRQMESQLQFRPEEYNLRRQRDDEEFMFLNLGPHHPGTHGVLRLVLQLRDEQIINIVPEIGFHHRGAEKMGERQSWHTYIPYTDRVDYLGGVMNNLPYVLAVEKLAGIDIPPRAQVIRVMMCELFRIYSHLVWYGTFALDVGAFSPVFFMFTDRERILEIVEAVTGARMHPSWFRIGGVAHDLPQGWDELVRKFVDYFPARIREYDKMVMENFIFKKRTVGVGEFDTATAIDWGITGPNLRATGFEWDFRKRRPYSAYDQFEFDIPTGKRGDSYDRAALRVEEMRQSLRIIRQCLDNMPSGDYKSRHPLTTPPIKNYTMQDIETLITHFLNVTWGPVIPAGEALANVEGTKGAYGYYLISDGGTGSYRTRIRTASFPHIQAVPMMSKGLMIADLIAILGSIDFVLADVDK